MSYTYRMAKAYQEHLLQQANPPRSMEDHQSWAELAPRTGITTLVNLLTAPMVLFRRATDAETTV